VDRQRQRETNPKYDRLAYGHNTISVDPEIDRVDRLTVELS